MNKFIFKANNNVLSHCTCEDEPAMSGGQADCPWCGCGWLISCSKCAKSFTFAEVRETNISLEILARREAVRRGKGDMISSDNIAKWVTSMTTLLAPFDTGQKLVYLDGRYFPVDAHNINFKGIYAEHKFSVLPHYEALDDASILESILGSPTYWRDRARFNRVIH